MSSGNANAGSTPAERETVLSSGLIISSFQPNTGGIMSKFNMTKTRNVTENLAGGKAYKSSAKLEIASLLMTSFLSDKFYESSGDTVHRLSELFDSLEDKKFLAKASIYARDKYRMRTIAHVCSALIAEKVHGEEWTKSYFDKVTMRVDDMLETVSYFWKDGKKPIPNSMKKGYSKAFGRFDEYQLAKYQAKNKELSLVDLMRLVHPKKTEKNASGLEKLVKGTLVNTETWNAKLSQNLSKKELTDEQKAEVKKETWAEFVNKGDDKIEMFALLKNLRNIWTTDDENVRKKVLQLLVTPELIHRSKILPFRFYTAYRELRGLPDSSRLILALSQAADIALDNVPLFDGKTAILLDVSGSMSGRVSEIASLFGAALYKKNDADLILFDEVARHVDQVNAADSLFTIANSLRFNGGGTDFSCAIRALGAKRYDRIIILSDMQSWSDCIRSIWHVPVNKAFNAYKSKINPEVKLFSFDLAGYGTLQFPETNVFCLAGFSENTFDLMQKLDKGVSDLIAEIEKVQL